MLLAKYVDIKKRSIFAINCVKQCSLTTQKKKKITLFIIISVNKIYDLK